MKNAVLYVVEWAIPLLFLAAVIALGVWVGLLFAPWSIFILMGCFVAALIADEVSRHIHIKKLHEFLRVNNGKISGFIVNEYLWASIGNGIEFPGRTHAETVRLKHKVIIQARRIVGAPKDMDPNEPHDID